MLVESSNWVEITADQLVYYFCFCYLAAVVAEVVTEVGEVELCWLAVEDQEEVEAIPSAVLASLSEFLVLSSPWGFAFLWDCLPPYCYFFESVPDLLFLLHLLVNCQKGNLHHLHRKVLFPLLHASVDLCLLFQSALASCPIQIESFSQEASAAHVYLTATR